MKPDELDPMPGNLKRHEVKDVSLIRKTFVDGLSPDEVAGLLSTQADSIMYWQGMYVKVCQENASLREALTQLHATKDVIP